MRFFCFFIVFMMSTFSLYADISGDKVCIFNTLTQKRIPFSTLLNNVNKDYSVVFVGEYHDDIVTHRLELEILNGLYVFDKNWNVSMEMFERDVQNTMNAYLDNKISETSFIHTSRPWNNYKDSYRPIIEFAKNNGLDVIAANIPRKYAAMLVRNKWEKLNRLPYTERSYIADKLIVINDKYRMKFFQTMIQNMGSHIASESMIEKVYRAQCIKDDTMAESIYDYLKKNKGKKIVHFNGRFHSDEHLGTAQKLSLLDTNLKIGVISIVPVEGRLPEHIIIQDRSAGDYIVYCKTENDHRRSPKNMMFKNNK